MEAPATTLNGKRTFPYSPEREESPEAKRLREDLLDILEDDDGAVERNATAVGELDSVLRSLEEEIGLSASPANTRDEDGQLSPAAAQQWCAQPADGYHQLQHSELGFLLEASDDELGLPPSGPSTSEEEGQRQPLEDETTSAVFLPSADAVELGQIWGFEDDIPSPYEGFGFQYPSAAGSIHGAGDAASGLLVSDANVGGFVADSEGVMFHGGLFDDFSDAAAPSDILWRQETLPAL